MPPAAICDYAKEMIPGEFNRELKEASCHLKQTEPFNPWLNAAKREMKELKKGSSMKFIKNGTLRRLWGDCVKLESYIRSNTTHSIYKLDGEVPETMKSREMFNIGQLCESEWFKWVMF